MHARALFELCMATHEHCTEKAHAVAYLRFQKEGKFSLATIAYTRGRQIIFSNFFLWWKTNFLPKEARDPMAPLNTPLATWHRPDIALALYKQHGHAWAHHGSDTARKSTSNTGTARRHVAGIWRGQDTGTTHAGIATSSGIDMTMGTGPTGTVNC